MHGRLPNLHALRDGLREGVGNLFTIRGVEAVVEGKLIERDREAVLQLPDGVGELRLSPLKRKVQYDPKAQRDEPVSPDERDAYSRLLSDWDRRPRRLRVTGPLTQPGDKGTPTILEVRDSEWIKRPRRGLQ